MKTNHSPFSNQKLPKRVTGIVPATLLITVLAVATASWLHGQPAAAPAATPAPAEVTVAANDAPPAQPERLTLDQLKEIITKKNIFRPARVPARDLPLPVEPDDTAFELGPRRLKYTFKVVGFVTADEQDFVHLYFAETNEVRKAPVGSTIEFVKIIEIAPPYIRCDYDGRRVRIDVGETSDDAYQRLTGLSDNYRLISTTVTGESRSARFYFPSEDRIRMIEEGDILGSARVYRIEHEQVLLRYDDGYVHPIKPGAIDR